MVLLDPHLFAVLALDIRLKTTYGIDREAVKKPSVRRKRRGLLLRLHG
jgi:hypothetical protein